MLITSPIASSCFDQRRGLICGLGVAATLFAGSVEAVGRPQLLLAGGATPVCSSVDVRHCVEGRAPTPAPLANRFRLDADGIARVADSGWLAHRRTQRDRIFAALRRWLKDAGEVDLTAAELSAALDARPKADARAWRDLAGFEQARVRDALERVPTVETVALAHSHADSGAAIFREFIDMARLAGGRQRPRVLVSTASSRDPFAAISYYVQLFEQAGAEVRWLPLDHALRKAQLNPERDCDRLDRLRGQLLAAHDRDRLYPEPAAQLAAACVDPTNLKADIEWADAVFLNGGDQSFTRAAWFAPDGVAVSAELELLLARLHAGNLVVGGTSAGTAVQAARQGTAPMAMLVSGPALPGTAALALRTLPPDPGCAAADACAGTDPDALLYHPGGGLGTFPFGVLDTHFSERGREYRLARLLLDAGIDLGIGVDENTALRLDRDADTWHGSVIGQGQVTLLRRVSASQVQHQHFAAGSGLSLPPPEATPIECAAVDSAATEVPADSDALSAFIRSIDAPRASALTLVQGDDRQAAGQLCASTDGAIRQWEFEPQETAPAPWNPDLAKHLVDH